MIEGLYQNCGILATFLGTLLEGEIMLLTSVLSAKMGLFTYHWAMVAGFFGAYTQAWVKFLIAKKQGAKLLLKKPDLQKKLDKASSWFDKRPYAILSVYRFMFGMSTIIILMSGLKNISYVRFGIHAGIGIFLWLMLFGGIGYFCAERMIANINSISEYKWYIIGTMALIGLSVWFFRHRKINEHCFEVAA